MLNKSDLTDLRGGANMFEGNERGRADAIDYYANLFPEELKEAVRAFDNKVRQAIVAALLCEGEMSFAELRDLLVLKNSRMSPHLRMLINGKLIENFFKEEFGERKHSFYRISPYGHKFIKSLFDSLSTTDILIPPLVDIKPERTQPWKTFYKGGEEGAPLDKLHVSWDLPTITIASGTKVTTISQTGQVIRKELRVSSGKVN